MPLASVGVKTVAIALDILLITSFRARTMRRILDRGHLEALQDEECSPPNKRKQHGRSQAADFEDDDVAESIEQGAPSSKGKQSAKRTTRSRTTTPGARSATAGPESETILFYNSEI